MFMEVRGTDEQGHSICRSWYLVADGESGPAVPTLAAVAIIRRCLHGATPDAGARPAMNDLELSDYEAMFDSLQIHTGTRDESPGSRHSLFENVLGTSFHSLPAPIRELHSVPGDAGFSGRASISRGNGILARIIAWFVGFPAANDDTPVSVRIEQQGLQESWQRDFDGDVFSSEMSVNNGRQAGLICERFGPARFGMALVVEGDTLHYIPRRWTFLGLPMPKWMLPGGAMLETVRDGKFVFHVEITLPLVGHVVTYKGYLEPDD
jgi:hypothetical protein